MAAGRAHARTSPGPAPQPPPTQWAVCGHIQPSIYVPTHPTSVSPSAISRQHGVIKPAAVTVVVSWRLTCPPRVYWQHCSLNHPTFTIFISNIDLSARIRMHGMGSRGKSLDPKGNCTQQAWWKDP